MLDVIDMTEFVAQQRERLASGGAAGLSMPVEHVYRPGDPSIARRLQLD